MKHTPSLRVSAALALLLCLHATGRADENTAAKCCNTSSTECKTGQSVGDKGSCPGSQVCAQIADKCSKKHPGVFCSCADKEGSLEVSATELTFDKKSRKGSLTVSNAGNVPLDITIVESGDTDSFAVQETRKCKKKRVSPAERRAFRALLAPASTAVVPPQGCVNLRVRFTAKKKGVYSEQVAIQSDANTPPAEASVTLLGVVGNPGTGPTTTTTETTTTTTVVHGSTTSTTTVSNRACATVHVFFYSCGITPIVVNSTPAGIECPSNCSADFGPSVGMVSFSPVVFTTPITFGGDCTSDGSLDLSKAIAPGCEQSCDCTTPGM